MVMMMLLMMVDQLWWVPSVYHLYQNQC